MRSVQGRVNQSLEIADILPEAQEILGKNVQGGWLPPVTTRHKIMTSTDGHSGTEATIRSAASPMSQPPPDLRNHLTLALVRGLGPKLTRAVLNHFGSADRALQATVAQLQEIPQVGANLAAKFASEFRSVSIDAEWDLLQRHGVTAIPFTSPDYPSMLSSIDDAPPLLYLKGALTAADVRAVGIVGSRSCTPYGIRMAERLASGLATAGWTVVSGLALGIDGAAHRAALNAGGRTLAVLAGGLASIYPPDHVDLAQQVAAQGALITETPMTLRPQAGMFPARNRIISGLCRGVIIVEANARSGALITASHAAEQGREVFVVPGNADSAASAGCLSLLRKGARLVRSVDDVLEDLQGLSTPDPAPVKSRVAQTLFDAPPPPPPPPTTPPSHLDATESKVWAALAEPRHADVLSREVGLSPGELATVLMKLELKKAIRRLPGNQYERR